MTYSEDRNLLEESYSKKDDVQETHISNPLITVLLCSHSPDYIMEATNTAIDQTLNKDAYEVIAVLDYHDPTIEEQLSKSGVFCSILPNSKWGEAMAHGIMKARGSIICFLADDDEFDKTKLKTILSVFILNPELIYVHNSIEVMNQNEIKPSRGNSLKTDTIFHTKPTDFAETMALAKLLTRRRLDFNASSISVKREFILKYVPIIMKLTTLIDSIIFYLSLETDGYIMGLSEPLTRYRLHNSMSNSLTINAAAIEKYVFWSAQICMSLEEVLSTDINDNLRKLLEQKKSSVQLLSSLFDRKKQRIQVETAMYFLRSHLFFRPLYAILILSFLIVKSITPSRLYYRLSQLLFKIVFV